MERYVAKAGIAEVEVTGNVEAHIRRVVDGIAPAVARRFEAAAQRVLDEAGPNWPNRTGTSWRGFRVSTSITPTQLVTKIGNTTRYYYYVRFSRYSRAEVLAAGKTPKAKRRFERIHGKGAPRPEWIMKSAWQVLVRKPALRSMKRLAKDPVLGRDLQRLLDGRAA